MSKKHYVFADVEIGLAEINKLCLEGWVVVGGPPEIMFKDTEKTWFEGGLWHSSKLNEPWKVRATLELINEHTP